MDMAEEHRRAYEEAYERITGRFALPASTSAAAAALPSANEADFTLRWFLSGIWRLIRHVLERCLSDTTWALLVASIFFALWNAGALVRGFGPVCDRCRDWYDDWTLRHDRGERLRRAYDSFRRTGDFLALDLQYNPTTDSMRRGYMEVGRAFDRFIGNIPKYMAIGALLWTVYVFFFSGYPRARQATWQEQADRGVHVPPWMLQPRKEQGSNAHHHRLDPAEVAAVGMDGKLIHTITTQHSWQPLTIRPDVIISTPFAAPAVVKTFTKTLMVTETVSMPELPTAVAEPDFWAPASDSSGTKSIAGGQTAFCQACQQYHCCEVSH